MKRFLPFLLAMPIACMFVSCASTSAARSSDPARLYVAAEKELKSSFGTTFAINPYLEPKGMFRGKANEFVVLRLDLDLPVITQVSLAGNVQNEAGQIIARAMSIEDMKAFWEMWQASDADSGRRMATLQRSYAPGDTFVAKAGRKSYYLVISGKYPLPRPAVIKAFVIVGNLPPVIIEQPLPDSIED